MIKRYAHLLAHYSLSLKKGEKVLIHTTTVAEDLAREVYREALKIGSIPEVELDFRGKRRILMEEGNAEQLAYLPTLYKKAIEEYDAYLFIRAPYNHAENKSLKKGSVQKRSKALMPIHNTYSLRTAKRALKRTLCEYPTAASAQIAGMPLEQYETFIFKACKLCDKDPIASWKKVSKMQQGIVDYLNKSENIRYKGPRTDVSFSVKKRIWINSDGQTNMPSGEVFTSPIEDSVNGTVFFDYPAIFKGEEVKNVTLQIKDGKVVKWKAERGQGLLDMVMKIKGARFFGEVAIGTNYDITIPTKNILFDEKIGGTIHMALGQSYKQTGGQNESSLHWDLISDMTQGSIFADGTKIYDNGKFLIK
ncbi:MAG: aminopeptidase [Saprospiraceae bacterium]